MADARSSDRISIVLIDDHAVIRSALRMLLDGEPGFEVVAEGGDVGSAIMAAAEHHPGVLILDLSLPGESGLAAIPAIRERSPDTKIVVLTMNDSSETVREALRAGVHGYILKEAAEEELIKAVRLAGQGERYVQPSLGAQLAAELEDGGPPSGLSDREVEVLHLIALGHTNMEIAEKLCLSVRTVESHRANVQLKLDCSGRSELVRYAIDNGLVEMSGGRTPYPTPTLT
jgi:two-component system, NarL family, response regulator NreC